MKVRALRDKILIEKIEKGERKTAAGIVIVDDDGKDSGVRARWGRVYAVGPDVKADITPGQWVYIEHGRWTRGMEIQEEGEPTKTLWGTTEAEVLLVADEQPVEFAERY